MQRPRAAVLAHMRPPHAQAMACGTMGARDNAQDALTNVTQVWCAKHRAVFAFVRGGGTEIWATSRDASHRTTLDTRSARV